MNALRIKILGEYPLEAGRGFRAQREVRSVLMIESRHVLLTVLLSATWRNPNSSPPISGCLPYPNGFPVATNRISFVSSLDIEGVTVGGLRVRVVVWRTQPDEAACFRSSIHLPEADSGHWSGSNGDPLAGTTTRGEGRQNFALKGYTDRTTINFS